MRMKLAGALLIIASLWYLGIALNLPEGQTTSQIVRHWTLPILLFAVGGLLIWRSGRNY
jgi:hypothetical protein